MVNRTNPNTAADVVFTETEMTILDQLVGAPDQPTSKKLSIDIESLARLGGYLARKNDGPPGNNVIWRGISRLTDVSIGVELGENLWVIERFTERSNKRLTFETTRTIGLS